MDRELATELLWEMSFTATESYRQALETAINALSDYDKMQKISLDLAFENDELMNKSKWIPVSERLPEKNDVYLVAVEAFGYPRRDVDGFIGQTPRKWEHYGNKVVAWMPLPDPYKAER